MMETSIIFIFSLLKLEITFFFGLTPSSRMM